VASDARRCALGLTAAVTFSIGLTLAGCKEPEASRVAAATAETPAARGGEVPIGRGSGAVSVQVLVDESGSMGGYRAALPRFEGWIWRGISRTRSYGYDYESQLNCGFSQPKGIVCGSATVAPRSMRGSTNLDAAITRSAQADLTIIVTDGVAATGSRPSDLCAGGVDAACVGIQLAEAIRASTGTTVDAGAWVLPVSAHFDGDFYTERRVQVSSFDPASVDGVADAKAAVSRPRNTQSGELVYVYRGEKPLLLIVISRPSNLGRAFIAGLVETRSMESGPDIGKRYASLELYPGYAPKFRWSSIRRSADFPNVAKDARLDEASQRLTFRCGASGQKPGTWDLVAARSESGTVATVNLVSLPVSMIASRIGAAGIQIVPVSLSHDALRVKAVIDCGFKNPDCSADATYRVRATRRPGTAPEIAEWSTFEPEVNPSKVFGLSTIVQSFYQRFGEMPDLTMAELRVCSVGQ
jgi:hypothetical protein